MKQKTTISVTTFFKWGLGTLALVVLIAAIYEKITRPPHVDDIRRFYDVLEEGSSPILEKEARTIMAELIPVVEGVAGREFLDIPKIRLVSRNRLAEVLVRDSALHAQHSIENGSGDGSVRLTREQAERLAVTTLGKYSCQDRALYLSAGNISHIFKLLKIHNRHVRSVMRLVIAHELTHALQDQELDLAKSLQKVKGNEERDALRATIEGHAVFVQERVGRQLSIDDGVLEKSRLLFVGLAGLKEPTFQIASKTSAGRSEFIYVRGKEFIAYHHIKGGNQRIWEILENPPSDAGMIAEPETYSATRSLLFEYSEILDGLDAYLGKGPFSVHNFEISKASLYGSYADMDPAKRESFISRIEHVQALRVKRAEPFGQVTIAFFVMKDSKCASELMSAVEQTTRNNMERMDRSSIFDLKHFSIEEFSGIQADTSRKISAVLLPRVKKQNPTSQSIEHVLICRGNILLVIRDNGFAASDDKIVAIANEAFGRVAQKTSLPET